MNIERSSVGGEVDIDFYTPALHAYITIIGPAGRVYFLAKKWQVVSIRRIV